MKHFIAFAGSITLALGLLACAQAKSAAKKAGIDDSTVSQAESAAEQGQAEAEKAVEDAPKNVLQTAILRGNHTTLVTALEKAGLYQTLGGEGPYTLFAPTDSAFQAMPKEKRDELLNNDDTTALKALLEAHVVEGKLMVSDIVEQDALTSVGGGNLTVEASGDKRNAKVGGADLSIPDLEASNGVVHVLDVVLMPASNS
jgi:uncharacterized surface protein with fasciclin (FAS1) repeats